MADQVTADMNVLAKEITDAEGLKDSLSIAQVKEVLRHAARLVAKSPDMTVAFLQYGKKQGREHKPKLVKEKKSKTV